MTNSQTIENTAVILIGSRLCSEVVDPSLGLAELGGVVAGLQADFFQRFDAQRGRISSNAAPLLMYFRQQLVQ